MRGFGIGIGLEAEFLGEGVGRAVEFGVGLVGAGGDLGADAGDEVGANTIAVQGLGGEFDAIAAIERAGTLWGGFGRGAWWSILRVSRDLIETGARETVEVVDVVCHWADVLLRRWASVVPASRGFLAYALVVSKR